MPRNDYLRQHRIQRNWRQQDIADQLGVTRVTVQRWERGTQQPSAYYRVKLCELFGLTDQELGLAEAIFPPIPSEREAPGAEPPEAPATEDITLWTVPYARNLHFTGRDELLYQLEQQLSPVVPDQAGVIRQAALTQSQVLKGLGGIGKTQIAVEYAYRARELGRYTHTLWISAASEETILTSFVTIADLLPALHSKREMDQRQLVALVLRWLERSPQPWLLIFDNADDIALVQPYLPLQGNGRILLTTRASAVGSLASSIEVDNMEVREGVQFLLRRAQREADASTKEIEEARRLVVELAQFPLALDQAGAYIEETGCGFSTYQQLYQDHRHTLLATRGMQTSHHPDPVATTWSLSFERIEEANPAAAQLLHLCAFLAPDHIPEELLTQSAAYWPPELQRATADPLAFNHLLRDLLTFSLVKRLNRDRMLSLHRLVQVVQLERMEPEEQRQWAERVVCAVHAIFPDNPKDVATWPLCQRYLEQVEACDMLIQQYQMVLPETAGLLDRAGVYLKEVGSYRLAEPILQRALQIREQQVGSHHLDTAQSLNNLAQLCFRLGKYEQAQLLLQRALQIREQQVGSHHLDTAQSLTSLATLYRDLGEYKQAQQLLQRALQIRVQQLGPDHEKTAIDLYYLAGVYIDLGKYAQAESLFQKALAIWEPRLGPEHPNVGHSFNALAFLYAEQGKYEQAEALYQRTLAIWEPHLGPEHPFVAAALTGQADMYSYQGKYRQAEPLYQRALTIMEQQLISEHPNIAKVLIGLANLYSGQGKYGQAEPLYQRALSILKQQKHPDVARALTGLATLYREQGKYGQAEPLYQRALSIFEQQVGEEHPDTAQVIYEMAVLQEIQDHPQEALSLYQQALVIRERVLGLDHPKARDTLQRSTALWQLLSRERHLSRRTR